MPAITGRFEADFSQYKSETQSAAEQLKAFEASADDAAASVDNLAGKGTTLAAGVGTSATAAAGDLSKLGTAATTTASGFTQLSQGLGATDKMLSALGVHIGPEIRAIGELGKLSGTTATSLGLMGTAGLVVGTAIAAWNVGRAISDFLGLDEAIGKATASLLGWGDAAAEAAGAKADTLAKASKIAGRAITDYAEAVRIVGKAQAEFAETFNTSAQRVKTWESAIDGLRQKGTLEALKADMLSHNSTMEQMVSHYGISAEAIGYLQRQLDKEAASREKAAAAAEKQREALEKLQEQQKQADEAIRQGADALFGTDKIKAAEDMAAMIGRVENVSNLTADAQARVNDTMFEAIDVMVRMGLATDPLIDKFVALELAATASARELNAAIAATAAAAAQAAAQMDALLRSYKNSGGTDVSGFTSGLSIIGASAPGARPSGVTAFTSNELAPAASQTNIFNVNGTGESVARYVLDTLRNTAMVGTFIPTTN